MWNSWLLYRVPRLKEEDTTIWRGQYNGSIELMVRWNEGPCGFDGGLKLKNPL